jgi:hypothetical protein
VRPPRMPIARAHREAEPAIKIRSRIEIADSMDDVIEAAAHAVYLLAVHRSSAKNSSLEILVCLRMS